MDFDVLGAVAFTATAGVTLGALLWSADLGGQRARLALTLGAWFLIVAALAAANVFVVVGAPAVGVAVALPLLALGYAASQPGLLGRARAAVPLPALIAAHAWRVIPGTYFLLLHGAGRLTAPFAPFAGWGDIVVGALAAPVAAMVYARTSGWRSAAALWNLLGLLDLLVALTLGIASAPDSPLRLFPAEPGSRVLSSLPWILVPAYLVPLLILTHVEVFTRLAAAVRGIPRTGRTNPGARP